MSGRIYRLRGRRKVNYFTYEDYASICRDIVVANHLTTPNKQVVVTHAKNKGAGVSNMINEVLKKNNISVVRSNKYASSAKKWLFVFNSKGDAQRAADIINVMATPDSIDPTQIRTDGSVTSTYGLKLKVDVKTDNNGNVVAVGGGNYVSGTTNSQQAETQESDTTLKWVLIGGAVLVGIIVILAVLKKTNKI